MNNNEHYLELKRKHIPEGAIINSEHWLGNSSTMVVVFMYENKVQTVRFFPLQDNKEPIFEKEIIIEPVEIDPLLEYRIGAFLINRCESDGGWAKVEKNDMQQLYAIIEQLIDLKCDRDPDGDQTIEFALVDRQTHRFEIDPWLLTMPYESDDDNPLAAGGKLEKLSHLATILTDKVNREMTRARWVQEGKI